MKMNLNLVLVLFAYSCTCFAQVNSKTVVSETNIKTHVFRYTNPITRDTSISMRDHCIIKVGNQWY